MIPHLSPSKGKNNRVGMSFDEGPGGSNGALKPNDPHQERVKRAHSNEFFRPRVFSASEAAPKGGGIVRNMVHATFDRDVNDVYETTNATTLGTGLSGSVVRVVHRVTKVPYAMKTLRLEKTPTKKDLSEVLNDMKAEIEIMAELDHPNIVRLIDTFYTDTTVYLIMELVEGGELFDHLIYCSTKKGYGGFGEKDAAATVRKITAAVRYLHNHNIVHRDLKLENVLLTRPPKDTSISSSFASMELKICDFGLSDHFKPGGDHFHATLGTPYYIAPEVLKGDYDEKCDIWSIGVIAFMLLGGTPPFDGGSTADILAATEKGEYSFQGRAWERVSDQARDFIAQCLQLNVKRRPTAEQLLKHPWLVSAKEQAAMEISSPVGESVLGNLVKFRKFSLLKRIALEVVAFSLEPAQIESLRQDFEKFDTQQTGEISVKDFHEVLDSRMSADDVNRIFESIDLAHTGLVHWHEFLAAALDMNTVDDAHLRLAFSHLDHQGKGFVTQEDVDSLLGDDKLANSKYSQGRTAAIFAGADGSIDEEAFVALCRSNTQALGSLRRAKSVKFVNSPTLSPRSPSQLR